MEDEDRPLLRGDAAERLSKESLDSYSQDELHQRVALLDAEIARVKAHSQKVALHKEVADALFRPPSS